MKITDQDIVRTTQELRDEGNNQMTVRPWTKGEKAKRLKGENNSSLSSSTFQLFNFSTFTKWLVATPAAAFAGFAFGIWTQVHKQTETSPTALVDTIYIKVPVPQPPQQQAVVEAVPAIGGIAPKRAARPKQTLGHPLGEDNIRYDLLVCN